MLAVTSVTSNGKMSCNRTSFYKKNMVCIRVQTESSNGWKSKEISWRKELKTYLYRVEKGEIHVKIWFVAQFGWVGQYLAWYWLVDWLHVDRDEEWSSPVSHGVKIFSELIITSHCYTLIGATLFGCQTIHYPPIMYALNI